MNILSNIPIYWINNEFNDENDKIFINKIKTPLEKYKEFEHYDYFKKNNIIAIQQAYNDNVNNAIILNGDINFHYLKHHIISIDELIKNNDYRIIQLCQTTSKDIMLKNIELDFGIYDDYYDNISCYYITRNGMKEIIDNQFVNKEIFSLLKLAM